MVVDSKVPFADILDVEQPNQRDALGVEKCSFEGGGLEKKGDFHFQLGSWKKAFV